MRWYLIVSYIYFSGYALTLPPTEATVDRYKATSMVLVGAPIIFPFLVFKDVSDFWENY